MNSFRNLWNAIDGKRSLCSDRIKAAGWPSWQQASTTWLLPKIIAVDSAGNPVTIRDRLSTEGFYHVAAYESRYPHLSSSTDFIRLPGQPFARRNPLAGHVDACPTMHPTPFYFLPFRIVHDPSTGAIMIAKNGL